MKVTPGASIGVAVVIGDREGYLVTDGHQDSECVRRSVTWTYLPGGYFYRPANTLNGGADAGDTESIWVLRERTAGCEQICQPVSDTASGMFFDRSKAQRSGSHDC